MATEHVYIDPYNTYSIADVIDRIVEVRVRDAIDDVRLERDQTLQANDKLQEIVERLESDFAELLVRYEAIKDAYDELAGAVDD